MPNLIDELTDLVVLYDAKLSDRQLDIYLEALSDISPEDLHYGIVLLTKTSKWMPKISEIRQAVADARDKAEAAEAERWHDRRNALVNSPWVQVETWERRSHVEIPPAVIDWRTCPSCSARYAAEWGECPDCSRTAADQLVWIERAA